MYRSPKASSSGASGFLMLIFLVWGALYIAGCADVSTGTGIDLQESMDPVEIELAVNEGLTSLLIEDVSNTIGSEMNSSAASYIETATTLFASARVANSTGDSETVVKRGSEARIALARALQAAGNAPLRGYIDRTRQLRDRLASGDASDEFNNPSDVLASLTDAVAAIESDMARGDELRAADRAVRANSDTDRARDRRHDRREHDRSDRTDRGDRGDRNTDVGPLAEFLVAMSGQSVSIADRFLEGTDPTERQIHALETAARMSESANTAFAEGQLRHAIALSHRAVSLSLMSVVMPEVTVEDAAAIEEFAAAELEAAGSRELTELEARWLERAQQAFDRGVEMVRAGDLGGVHLIWRAGVAAAVLTA